MVALLRSLKFGVALAALAIAAVSARPVSEQTAAVADDRTRRAAPPLVDRERRGTCRNRWCLKRLNQFGWKPARVCGHHKCSGCALCEKICGNNEFGDNLENSEAMEAAVGSAATALADCHTSIDDIAGQLEELRDGADKAHAITTELHEEAEKIADLVDLAAVYANQLGKVPKVGIFIKAGLKASDRISGVLDRVAETMNNATTKISAVVNFTESVFSKAANVTGPTSEALTGAHAVLHAAVDCAKASPCDDAVENLEAANLEALSTYGAGEVLGVVEGASDACVIALDPNGVLGAALALIVQAAKDIVDEIAKLIDPVIEKIGAFIEEVARAITEFGEALLDNEGAQCLLEIFGPVADFVSLVTCPVDEAVSFFFEEVVEAVLGVVDDLEQQVQGLVASALEKAIPDDFSLEIPDVRDLLPAEVWLATCTAAASALPEHADLITYIHGLELPLEITPAAIEHHALVAIFGPDDQAGANEVDSYSSACADAWNQMKEEPTFDNCKIIFEALGELVIDGLEFIGNGIVNGLATAARATAKFFKDAGKQIWRFVSSIFGNGGREFEDTDLEIDPDAPPMTLYQDTPGTDAGTGWVVSFGLGEYPQLLAQLDNQASAITVQPGYKVMTYKNANFGGSSSSRQTYYSGHHILRHQDEVSSIRVKHHDGEWDFQIKNGQNGKCLTKNGFTSSATNVGTYYGLSFKTCDPNDSDQLWNFFNDDGERHGKIKHASDDGKCLVYVPPSYFVDSGLVALDSCSDGSGLLMKHLFWEIDHYSGAIRAIPTHPCNFYADECTATDKCLEALNPSSATQVTVGDCDAGRSFDTFAGQKCKPTGSETLEYTDDPAFLGWIPDIDNAMTLAECWDLCLDSVDPYGRQCVAAQENADTERMRETGTVEDWSHCTQSSECQNADSYCRVGDTRCLSDAACDWANGNDGTDRDCTRMRETGTVEDWSHCTQSSECQNADSYCRVGDTRCLSDAACDWANGNDGTDRDCTRMRETGNTENRCALMWSCEETEPSEANAIYKRGGYDVNGAGAVAEHPVRWWQIQMVRE